MCLFCKVHLISNKIKGISTLCNVLANAGSIVHGHLRVEGKWYPLQTRRERSNPSMSPPSQFLQFKGSFHPSPFTRTLSTLHTRTTKRSVSPLTMNQSCLASFSCTANNCSSPLQSPRQIKLLWAKTKYRSCFKKQVRLLCGQTTLNSVHRYAY